MYGPWVYAWMTEHSLKELGLSFYCMGPRNPTQVDDLAAGTMSL